MRMANGLAGDGTFVTTTLPALTDTTVQLLDAASKLINAKNGNNTATTADTPQQNVGGNTYTPTNGRAIVVTEQKTDYTPWIIGGVALLGLGAMLMMNNNNKRR